MTKRFAVLFGIGAVIAGLAPSLTASNHREAPITALDHKADITDLYAFMGYGAGSAGKVTIIMSVDPLLDTANGPNWFPFDDEILYELKVDNNNDAREDVTLQFRFETDQRLPSLFQVYAGADNGYAAPPNSPAPVAPGTPIVPPRITSFDSAGLGQRQRYTVTAIRGSQRYELRPTDGRELYAVPANVGPRTMDYAALYQQGSYSLPSDIKVFAGTTDDAFWIDLGAAFDTFNLRSSVAPGVLSAAQDAAAENFASDTVSGYGVNTLAVEIPVRLLTRTGRVEPASSAAATLGIWGTTSRPRVSVRRNVNGVPDRSGTLPSGAAGGQSAHQRADHWHRLEGSLQHGPTVQRRAVRELLRRSFPAARPERADRQACWRFPARQGWICGRWSSTCRRLRLRAHPPGPSPICCASTRA